MLDSRADPPRRSSSPAPHRSFSVELGKWLEALRMQWLGPLDKTLGRWARFGFALSGSVTFWGYLFAREQFLDPQRAAETGTDWMSVIGPMVSFLMFSMWFALLISWKESPYSPTRFYVAGIMLPLIVTTILTELPETAAQIRKAVSTVFGGGG